MKRDDTFDDGLDAARGAVNGTVISVVFFWLPLGAALALVFGWRPW